MQKVCSPYFVMLFQIVGTCCFLIKQPLKDNTQNNDLFKHAATQFIQIDTKYSKVTAF